MSSFADLPIELYNIVIHGDIEIFHNLTLSCPPFARFISSNVTERAKLVSAFGFTLKTRAAGCDWILINRQSRVMGDRLCYGRRFDGAYVWLLKKERSGQYVLHHHSKPAVSMLGGKTYFFQYGRSFEYHRRIHRARWWGRHYKKRGY